MPRPLRINYENAWYHVMNRGANRQLIYKSNFHRNIFYAVLEEIVERFQIEIHAFCLMSNHYHLLVKTPLANLSKAMRHLNSVYTQRFNLTENRDGPLFRGRFKSILVDSDTYLLQVSRYIHLNPVEANICSHPAEYRWSSYRAYLNRTSFRWLHTSFILNQMSSSIYSEFIMEGLDEDTNNFYGKKQLASIFGSKKFVKEHLTNLKKPYIQAVLTDVNRTKTLPDKEIVIRNVVDYLEIKPEELNQSTQGKKNLPRIILVYLLRKIALATDKEIGAVLDIKKKSVSSFIRRIKMLLEKDVKLHHQVQEIIKRIKVAC